jgi:hypothetical protein
VSIDRAAPKRIQLRRTAGWRKPEGAIVVSRPSKWGNPFHVTKCWRVECGNDPFRWCVVHGETTEHMFSSPGELAARQFAVDCFAMWLSVAPRLWLAASELAGRDLACWCPLDGPCHADVLLEVANGGDV